MSSLKQKTISGLSWSFAGSFAGQAIGFVIGIILARLLSPREYGLIGMVTIFTILTQPFIDSGFSQALIRKKECTQTEFSTVFYFNVLSGIFFYIVIYFSAPYISLFFNEPQLTSLTRVIGLIIIVNSTSIIQTTTLTKDLNFKLQTKIGLISSVSSGVLGIFLAFSGFGVWALVVRSLTESAAKSIMLWLMNRWKPQIAFSLTVLKELFGFSSKLLASAILDKIYYNIYNLVIAKYFSARDLGLFTRAKMFKDLAAETISEIVGKVSFPAFASIQNEPQRLKNNYIQVLTSTNFIIWISMFVLASIAQPLITVLIGIQWSESIVYLQLLSFVGVFYPTHVLTRNILMVYGKSGLFLRLQIFTKALAVPAIIAGVIWGIKFMILAMIFTGIIEYLVKAYFSGKLIGYSVLQQLKDLGPTILLASIVGVILYLINQTLNISSFIILFIQLSIGTFVIIGFSEFFKLKEYLFIKEIAKTQIIGLMNRKKN